MTPALSTDKLEAILAGAATATPGPWTWGAQWLCKKLATNDPIQTGDYQPLAQVPLNDYDSPRWNADAAHIAACDPDTITSLITELLASRSTIEDLRRERDEARAATPHFHYPSAMHMGDCRICGNVADHPNHNADWKARAEAAERELAIVKEGGWKLVPVEVTLDMQKAYFDVIDKNMPRVEKDLRFGRFDSNREAYRAMLAAAPLPPAPALNGEQE